MSDHNNNDGRQLELSFEPSKSRRNLDLQKPTILEHTSDQNLPSKPVKSDENEVTHNLVKPEHTSKEQLPSDSTKGDENDGTQVRTNLDHTSEGQQNTEIEKNGENEDSQISANIKEFTSKQLASELEKRDGYKVLRKLTIPERVDSPLEEGESYGLYVDCETTGLNFKNDEIIEIGMVQFKYREPGEITAITEIYNSLQQPENKSISAEITRITGINMDDVEDQKIDLKEVDKLLNNADIVIAHNAQFDRPFFERLSPSFKNKNWACSVNDIPWRTSGMSMGKLDYLAFQFGFFFDGHRAKNDCFAGIEILKQKRPDSEKTYFEILLKNAQLESFIIWAVKAPYDLKDVLKDNRYRWNNGDNGKPKSWYKEVTKDKLEEETSFLKLEIYINGGNPTIETITAATRYSNRT